MSFIEMKTVLFSIILSSFICTVVLIVLWKQNRDHFMGTGFWVINFSFTTTSFFLIALRGKIPDLFSMGLSNILSVTGVFISILGLERFIGIRNRHFHNYIFLLIFSFVHIWFSIVTPDLSARTVNLSAMGSILCLQGLWLSIFSAGNKLKKLTFNVGLIFGSFAAISIYRIINIVFSNSVQSNDFLNSGLLNTLVMVSFQMLFILLTFSLVLMFNGRLMMEISFKEEELLKKIEDLEKFNRVTVDRELKMIELKKEINVLLKKAGDSEKYIIR